MAASASASFDRAAADYDAAFTETLLGRELRGLVGEKLDAIFGPGDRVLELNCGTGEDACRLALRGVSVTATDGSAAMLRLARSKAVARGASVRFRRLDLDHPEIAFAARSFDGAFSNFGGLNCVADGSRLADALGRWLRPNAALVLVVMGRVCPLDLVSHLLGGDVERAVARLRGESPARVGGATIRVRYPWPREWRRLFGASFRLERVTGLGVLLPPTYLGERLERYPGLSRALASWERRWAGRWPFRHLGDHTILQMRRRG